MRFSPGCFSVTVGMNVSFVHGMPHASFNFLPVMSLQLSPLLIRVSIEEPGSQI